MYTRELTLYKLYGTLNILGVTDMRIILVPDWYPRVPIILPVHRRGAIEVIRQFSKGTE